MSEPILKTDPDWFFQVLGIRERAYCSLQSCFHTTCCKIIRLTRHHAYLCDQYLSFRLPALSNPAHDREVYFALVWRNACGLVDLDAVL